MKQEQQEQQEHSKYQDHIDVKLKKLSHYDNTFPLPEYQSLLAAGADVRAQLNNRETFVIHAGKREAIPTGMAFAIPAGYEIQVRPRSGLSLKTSLMVVNAPGTIDADYRGELKILLGNMGDKDEIIRHGDRIAQLVLCPIVQARFVEVQELDETERGVGGFGSTGIN